MKTREKKVELKVENLQKENQELKGNLSSVHVELSNKTKENKKLTDKMAAAERSHEKVRISPIMSIVGSFHLNEDLSSFLASLFLHSGGVWSSCRAPVTAGQAQRNQDPVAAGKWQTQGS